MGQTADGWGGGRCGRSSICSDFRNRCTALDVRTGFTHDLTFVLGQRIGVGSNEKIPDRAYLNHQLLGGRVSLGRRMHGLSFRLNIRDCAGAGTCRRHRSGAVQGCGAAQSCYPTPPATAVIAMADGHLSKLWRPK